MIQDHPRQWRVSNRTSIFPTFGLIRIEADIPRSQSAYLDVRMGSVKQRFPLSALVVSETATDVHIRLHVVSHLFPNGPQVLETTLSAGPSFEPLEVDIQNIGHLAAWVREDLTNFGTPPFIGKFVDSKLFPASSKESTPWFNQEESFSEVALSFDPATSIEAAQQHLIRWGFTVLDYVMPREVVDQFRAEYQQAIDNGTLKYKKGSSQRIHHAHRLPAGRRIWLDQTVLKFLAMWFRDEPCACQTLLYVNGSEQDAHQDTIHLTPYPAGFMCGVWVALQDVQPGSGELFVYPGSHRTPRAMTADLGLEKVTDDYSSYSALTCRMDETLKANGFQRFDYLPKAGQILVWHENLIHGGAKRLYPELERHSIVSHYFARGCVAYYDSRGEAAALERLE